MKNKKLNGVEVWKQFEDLVVPRLRLSVFDRAVYSHLLRHSRLEGKEQFRFSILWLARGAGLSGFAVRKAVRRLIAKGALRLDERSRAGHAVKVRLPEEIRAVRTGRIAKREGMGPRTGDLEKVDFLETRTLRQAIHAREGGFCFYWLAPPEADGALRRPCGAACPGRAQWLPQPGVLLCGMQFAERGAAGRGFSPGTLPRRPFERRRTRQAFARAGGTCLREAAA